MSYKVLYAGDALPIAYSIDAAARLANVSRTQIYEAVKAGNLVIRKMGRRSLILDTELRSWLSSLPKSKAT